MSRLLRLLPAALLTVHILLVVGYTAPGRWVPPLWRAWSVALVRPLFHQRWDLFAPDPPRCACTLEVKRGRGDWTAVEADGPVARRMPHHLLAYLGGGEPLPDTLVVPDHWVPALRSLLNELPRAGGPVAFRTAQQCMDDPARPGERRVRYVQLILTMPIAR
ncbi:MAG: hypothetical protein IPJ87_02305 [Flavobacteriales bacterium]|nr:hypothetical protein [Flavobacteriales bacterium]MBK7940705.1 hypothetical protein [Flavobacteriales bacterium]MBK8949486.1 hypothetical protein [Flavobacteriales bacterium]MBK9700878.1 hypothetical protein [Flavobacteriales bacterium]